MRLSLRILLLLVFFGLAASSAAGDSPTMDEQNHIGRGLAFLRTGDPRLSVEHPPLVNSLSALPLLTEHVELPLSDWSWEVGEWYRFADLVLWQQAPDPERMVFLARLPIILLATLLGALLFRATRHWFGRAASTLALALYILDPNLMAHARYATTDLGATALGFLAAVALYWAAERDYRWGPTALAGAAFGLALGAKLSTTVLGAAFGLLALIDLAVWRWGDWRRLGASVLRLSIAYPAAALFVLWAIYGFDVGPVEGIGAAVPMPLFWRGVRTMLDFSGGGRPSFLLGHFSTEGFTAYFPVAFGVKTPLALLFLLLWAAGRFIVRLFRDRDARSWAGMRAPLFLLLVPAIYFVASLQSALNLGYRHLLPMLPFLFAFVAGQLGEMVRPRPSRALTHGVPGALVLLLIGWLVVANGFIYPHYLSYFNELVGPANGYHVLVDSNIDWGQDLKRLKSWMDRSGVDRIKLAWFGSAPPEAYGIAYDPLPGMPHHFDLWEDPPFDPAAPEPAIYAISVSILQELHRRDEDKTVFTWFRNREPDDRVGYSILIYRVAAGGG
jgi:4-amino-4-deoxy-L-arabinose transferase-like glycosyltransferase